MIEWKEKRLVPKEGATHIKEGYEDPCEECMCEIDCEECDVSVPIVCDEYEVKEVTVRQMTLCGIPVGHPYEVDEFE